MEDTKNPFNHDIHGQTLWMEKMLAVLETNLAHQVYRIVLDIADCNYSDGIVWSRMSRIYVFTNLKSY